MQDSIGMGWEERTVTVNKVRLLATLKTNRDKHQREYQESLAGYKDAAMQQLERQVHKARKAITDNTDLLQKQILEFDPDEPPSNQLVVLQQIAFTLEVPQDHTKSYDIAIQMADWETADEIVLTQSQFQCFVLDDWDWKKKFEYLNKSYTSRR